jgi:hypothetical protein
MNFTVAGFSSSAGAIFSECRRYRYVLWRTWEKTKKAHIAFIGLNPSTANETVDDPTIRRCIEYSKELGFGGMFMLNIFAFRATDPKVMKAESDPVGADNDYWLRKICCEYTDDLVIAQWGNHGVHRGRSTEVRRLVPQLHCFGITQIGEPKHILYQPYGIKPLLLSGGVA